MVDRKLLRLEVNAGLCNRLRALIAGICWAEKLDRKLVVYWPSFKPECAAAFNDLFLKNCLPDFVTVIDDVLDSPESCLQLPDAEYIFSQKSDLSIIDIKSHGNFWGSSDKTYVGYLRFLYPSPSVSSLLETWKQNGLSLPTCAFHIRMTDNQKAIRLSPFELFGKQIEKTPGPVVVFSDEPNAILALQENFGNRILSFESVRKRFCLEGMVEAAAVFFALASKQIIYGSANSSFSEVAHDFGGNELIILRI